MTLGSEFGGGLQETAAVMSGMPFVPPKLVASIAHGTDCPPTMVESVTAYEPPYNCLNVVVV